jgi:hypothetical protein
MGGAGWLRAGAAVVALVLPAAAGAQVEAPTGWDGVNPFRCTLQDAGFGSTLADPAADPLCVEYDKRRQNVTELGIVDFLLHEPARVAAALPRCFYFQADHWRAAVVQDDGATELYRWDGHYFFDKAKGNGGVWVSNFSVGGRTFDPSSLPGIPPEFARHMGPGTAGFMTRDDIPADPACAARAAAEPERIYASAETPPAGGCTDPAGPLTRRRLGPVALGSAEADVRTALGRPREVRRGFLRYCAEGGGALLVGFPADRSGDLGPPSAGRAVIVVSTAPALLRGAPRVRRGAPAVLRAGRLRVVRHRSGVLAGVRAGRVRFVAVADRRAVGSRSALRAALRRAGVLP